MEELITSLPLQKMLFIDQPFMEIASYRSQRSRFLWELLSAHYDADLLLLKNNAYLEKPVAAHFGYDKLFSLSLGAANKLYPDSYHTLATNQAERFSQILDSKRYELIVFAGLACMPLWRLARKILPQCLLILDIDTFYLPQVEAKWTADKRYSALPNLWNYTRQRVWDNLLLKADSHCFFSNPADAIAMQETFKLKTENLLCFPLPQNFTLEKDEIIENSARYILFWGDPQRAETLEVGKQIVATIYPRISKKLVEKNVGIVLCGHPGLAEICGGRIRYASMEEMQRPPILQPETRESSSPEESSNPPTLQPSNLPALLSNALFVLLPLTTGDSENRVFMAAMAQKAVVCTSAAISALQFPENCFVTAEDADSLALKIIRLLQYPREIEAAATNLHQHCAETFSSEAVQASILKEIQLWIEKHDTK